MVKKRGGLLEAALPLFLMWSAFDRLQYEACAGDDLNQVLVLLVHGQGVELGVNLACDTAEGLGRDVAERLARPPGEVGAVLDHVLLDYRELILGDTKKYRLVGLLADRAVPIEERQQVCSGVGGVQACQVHGHHLGVVSAKWLVVFGVGGVRIGLVENVGRTNSFFGALEQQTDSLEARHWRISFRWYRNFNTSLPNLP